MAVVREDTVKLSFQFDDSGVAIANDAMDDMVENTKKLGEAAERAEDGLDDAHKSAKKLGSTGVGALVSGLDKAADKAAQIALKLGAIAFKTVAAGVVAGTTAFAGLATQAIKSYAQYEQLVGGVETLFGDAQNTVFENANNAWYTAGLSANSYMETVTGFSASLLQSLGGDTQKAAEVADRALLDMSDKMLVRLKRIEPCQGCGAKRRQEMAA